MIISDKEEKEINVPAARNVTFRSTNNQINYAILRIDRKYFTLESVEAFEYHNERKNEVLNADPAKRNLNRILIGDENVCVNLEKHIEGVWKRKDSCIARDMVLTASPGFFKGISQLNLEKWINLNVEWVKKEYGDNCIFMCLHLDETSPHFHILISPIYINRRNEKAMSDKHYFGSKALLSNLQSNYADAMQSTFKSLRRGLKNSRATHIAIKKFYGIVNKSLDDKDIESIKAMAKNSELVDIKLRDVKRTLEAYKNSLFKQEEENEDVNMQNMKLFNNLKESKQDIEILNESMEAMRQYYDIPKKDLVKIVEYCKNKVKNKGKEK